MDTNTLRSQHPVRVDTPSTPAGVRTSQVHPLNAKFRIDGMISAFDADRLEHRLARQVGVIGVSVSTISDMAYITFDPRLTSVSLLQRQIEVSGYGVRPR